MDSEQGLAICKKAREWGYKPYHLAVVDGSLMEFISFPFVSDCGKVLIKVREINNPDSIRDAMIPVDHIMDMENM